MQGQPHALLLGSHADTFACPAATPAHIHSHAGHACTPPFFFINACSPPSSLPPAQVRVEVPSRGPVTGYFAMPNGKGPGQIQAIQEPLVIRPVGEMQYYEVGGETMKGGGGQTAGRRDWSWPLGTFGGDAAVCGGGREGQRGRPPPLLQVGALRCSHLRHWSAVASFSNVLLPTPSPCSLSSPPLSRCSFPPPPLRHLICSEAEARGPDEPPHEPVWPHDRVQRASHLRLPKDEGMGLGGIPQGQGESNSALSLSFLFFC